MKIIVMTTRGIKINASERIRSPAVDSLLVRATHSSSQNSPNLRAELVEALRQAQGARICRLSSSKPFDRLRAHMSEPPLIDDTVGNGFH